MRYIIDESDGQDGSKLASVGEGEPLEDFSTSPDAEPTPLAESGTTTPVYVGKAGRKNSAAVDDTLGLPKRFEEPSTTPPFPPPIPLPPMPKPE